jgi:quercetin dioxygenase-like cupin family protein
MKVLHDEHESVRCRALVLLEPGAALPAHKHGVGEDLYVLSGLLQVGSLEVHAGEIIRTEPDATTAPLAALTECILLLVGPEEDDPLASP